MGWRIFDQGNRFMDFMYMMSDLFLLNILCIVTSIPVITAGASITALYTVVAKMRKKEESYICRSYFRAFRDNFSQATVLWLFILVIGILLYFDLYVIASENMQGRDVLSVVFLIFTVFYILITAWIFPVLARYDTSVIKILKIAAYLSLRHIGYTLMILFIIYIPVVLIALNLYFLPVFLIISVSGCAYMNSYFFEKVYEKYVPLAK